MQSRMTVIVSNLDLLSESPHRTLLNPQTGDWAALAQGPARW